MSDEALSWKMVGNFLGAVAVLAAMGFAASGMASLMISAEATHQ